MSCLPISWCQHLTPPSKVCSMIANLAQYYNQGGHRKQGNREEIKEKYF